jgi:hypothetical protein
MERLPRDPHARLLAVKTMSGAPFPAPLRFNAVVGDEG